MLLPNISFVPNLKLLTSTVAEIIRVPKFMGCSPSPAPCQFLVLKLFFGKQLPVPKSYKNKFVAFVHLVTGTVCFKQKKLLFVMVNEDMESKFLVENVIFGMAGPGLPI